MADCGIYLTALSLFLYILSVIENKFQVKLFRLRYNRFNVLKLHASLMLKRRGLKHEKIIVGHRSNRCYTKL